MSKRIEQFLRSAIGLDVESIGRAAIDTAVRRRISACDCPGEAEYWPLVIGSAAERQALIDAVIVPETWFFRYPQSFDALTLLVREAVRQAQGTRPIRILSLPCSTGEEPYSVVMALLDAGVPEQCFDVDAVDVSAHALEIATKGLFRRNSFRSDDLGFRDRHFMPEGAEFRLSDAVTGKVRFRLGNLIGPNPTGGAAGYDFAFCRNLLIYFDKETQTRSARAMLGLLHETGVLFAGPAEASLLSLSGMEALNYPQAFVFRRRSRPPPGIEAAVPARAIAPPMPTSPRPATVMRQRGPAFAQYVPSPAPDGDGRSSQVAAISVLADSGRHDEAVRACEVYLANHGPAAEVFYTLGLLSDASGRSGAAEGFYRKALYLDPGHAGARAHMTARQPTRGGAGRRPRPGGPKIE